MLINNAHFDRVTLHSALTKFLTALCLCRKNHTNPVTNATLIQNFTFVKLFSEPFYFILFYIYILYFIYL
jgi:hypothetical protein